MIDTRANKNTMKQLTSVTLCVLAVVYLGKFMSVQLYISFIHYIYMRTANV